MRYHCENLICDSYSAEERVNLCKVVVLLLRNFTEDQYREQKPELNYSPVHHHKCREKDVVYQHLEKNTLKNVPMFFCSKYFIYFAATKRYGLTNHFYLRQGSTSRELLVFIDLPFCRRFGPSQPLENSVRLWYVVNIRTEDENAREELPDKLGISSIKEDTDSEKVKEEIICASGQMSRGSEEARPIDLQADGDAPQSS